MDSSRKQAAFTERIARVIFEHAARISQGEDIRALVRLNADLARDLTGADRCSVWLIDNKHNELWTPVAHGVSEIRIPLHQGIVGMCIAKDQPILVNDPVNYPDFLQHVDRDLGYQTGSVLAVPLRSDGEIVGALQVLNKPGGFSTQDRDLLQFMALYTSSSIQSERLRQEAQAALLVRRDLEIARDVQLRLFPQNGPDIERLTCVGFCRSARFVGGDYYDWFHLSEDEVAFSLGDVSGKGIAAAVLMASIHTLFRNLLLRKRSDLASLISELNHIILGISSPERYSTLFCGIVDRISNHLTYVNAGHIPPFIVRYSDGVIHRASSACLPVGLLPNTIFEETVVPVYPGDLIVCLSDGILEAENEAGDQWDSALLESILRVQRHDSIKDLVDTIITAVDAFVGGDEQFDDMTIVIMRV